jgi:extracellular elastinolytic metalloproteinase
MNLSEPGTSQLVFYSHKPLTHMRPCLPWKVIAMPLITFFLCISSSLNAQNTNAKQKLDAWFSKHSARLNLQSKDYSELFVTTSFTDASAGIEHIYSQQRINGIDVVGGQFAFHASTKMMKEYEADNLVKTSSLTIASTAATFNSEQAARVVLKEAHHPPTISLNIKESAGNKIIYARNDNPAFNIPVRKVYFPDNKEKKLALAWEVQMFDAIGKHYWIMYVDATTGKLLHKRDAIIHCNHLNPKYKTDAPGEISKEENPFIIPAEQQFKQDHTAKVFLGPPNKYKVFPEPFEAPNKPGATHVLTQNNGDVIGSPDGWHKVAGLLSYNFTRGNNAWAFYDPSPGPLGGVPNTATVAYANNGIGGTPPAVEPFEFDYPFNPAADPTASRNAAIVNLFYWNNLIHDVFYRFGFDENLNFQESHIYSSGLRGPADGQGDAVLAQAQDGGGTNNANFLTLPDGLPASAQMQMYLFTTATADQLVQIVSSTGTPAAGTKYNAVQGSFSNLPTANNDLYNTPVLNKQFVIIQKNALSTIGDSSQGCTTGQQSIALPPGNTVTDRIVLIDRGNCSFVEKVLGAQLGGAAGVIVINNIDGSPQAMGGTDAPANAIIIPAVMISKTDGEILKAAIRSGTVITGSLKKDIPNPPKRDGDFDNGVISHEYGHGISNRFTGGGDVLLPLGGDEQGGEGWSDFIGLYMTMRTSDLVVAAGYPNGKLPTKGLGTYVNYEPTTGNGIRPSKYDPIKSQSPYSFKDIGKGGEISIPHGVGHIWCQMLYSVEQEMIDLYGFNDNIYNAATPVSGNVPAGTGGNNVAMRLVTEGMKLQPINPTFEMQRDAILKADTLLYNAQHSCRIWKAFAKWGLGYSAKSNTDAVGDEIEAFDVPPACDASQVKAIISISASDTVINGGFITYTMKVKNIYPNPVSFSAATNKLPLGATYQNSVPAAGVSGRTVTYPVTTLAANEEKTYTVSAQVQTASAGNNLLVDNHEDGETGWTKSSTLPTANWNVVTTKPRSGTKSWFAPDVDGLSNMSLQTATAIAVPAAGAELIFWHSYATEDAFDGGVIEISNNSGATWTYLPPQKFVRNGYKGIIPIANNPLVGTEDRFAFTGTSGGYILSIADLGDYAGQSILIRFRISSDVGTAVDGWYIDDVYIMQGRTEIRDSAFVKVSNVAGFGAPLGLDSTSIITFVVGGSLSPLPAVLTELKALPKNDAIRLDWATLQEQNVQGFIVERQAQNERSFKSVGSLQSNGNSSSRRNYDFTDNSVQRNILYSYRIKMTDNNGSIRYTNIATAKIGDGKFGFAMMPNPAVNSIKLTFNNEPSSSAFLRVYDVSGKLMATWNVGNLSSVSTTINVSSFSNGVYWLELEDNGLKQTQKLVIQR